MSDPLTFENSSPRFGLPFLYVGQAQKEFYVNEALARADTLLHCAIEGTAATPPATPANGDAWHIASAPTGEWSGQSGKIASWQSGAWTYITPQDGMRIFNRATGQSWLYFSEWKIPQEVTTPTGGGNVDSEARVALNQLIAALKLAGILP